MAGMDISWHEEQMPNGLPVTQVAGFCFDDDGRILLIEDDHRFGIPGGKPEAGEDFEGTLRREVMEEASVLLGITTLVGYQRIQGDPDWFDGAPYAQVRMAAIVKCILPQVIDPATGITYARHWAPPVDIPRKLIWKPGAAKNQVDAAVRKWRRILRGGHIQCRDVPYG